MRILRLCNSYSINHFIFFEHIDKKAIKKKLYMKFSIEAKEGKKTVGRRTARTRTGAEVAKATLEKEFEGAKVDIKGGVFE